MSEGFMSASEAAAVATTQASPLRHLYYLLRSMRPKQWTKNGIVFMAFIFSVNQSWTPEEPSTWDSMVINASLMLLVFCLVAGADYLLNDVQDRAADAMHPRKSRRPIAASLLSPRAAIIWTVLLWTGGGALAFVVDWRSGLVVVVYMVTMLAYTYRLKNEVIIDVMIIAAGFVFRAMAGAYAVGVPISPWLYVVTALGALFLAITKRRAEVALLQADATGHRATLASYTPALLDQMTSMVTASTVIAYALYTFTAEGLPENHAMMLTIPFVAYGIFRYLFLALTQDEGGNPEDVLFKDMPLILTIVGWVATSMIVLTAYR